MEFLKNWIRELVALVLFAAFFEMLLPNHSMHKFIRVIVGLMILLTVLKPIEICLDKGIDESSVPVIYLQKQKEINQKVRSKNISYDIYKKELSRRIEATVHEIKGVREAKVKINLQEEKNKNLYESNIASVELAVKIEHTSVHETETVKEQIHKILWEFYQIPLEKAQIKIIL